jgi:hypothetical protein
MKMEKHEKPLPGVARQLPGSWSDAWRRLVANGTPYLFDMSTIAN